jgi:hypothetical protein
MSHRVKVKIDGNQPAIVDALLSAGYRVQSLAICGMGVPDLLVSRAGRMWLLEIKQPGESLTPYQHKWFETWATEVYIVHTPAEAINACQPTA